MAGAGGREGGGLLDPFSFSILDFEFFTFRMNTIKYK